MDHSCNTADQVMHQHLSQLIDDELCHAQASSSIDASDLESVSHLIGQPFPCDALVDDAQNSSNAISKCVVCSIVDLRRRMNLIKSHMGCMAQCRGTRGESLREAGAIDSLLSITWRLISSSNEDGTFSNLPAIENEQSLEASDNAIAVCCERHSHLRNYNNHSDFDIHAINELHATATDLACASLGALRDLACGSALNRAAFLSWEPPSSQTFHRMLIENGVHILVAYIQRYDRLSWEDILYLDDATNSAENTSDNNYTARGRKEIRMLTNALGAIRNTSHSTADVCQSFYSYGLVDLLMRRLVHDASATNNSDGVSVLPNASQPWREACFRTAGSLINLAEKCPDVATKLASNRKIVYILLETWGGSNAITCNNEKSKKSLRGLPLLHLGLAAVLNAAAANDGLDDIMIQVLEKEKERKKVAQRREEERKLRMKKAALSRDTV